MRPGNRLTLLICLAVLQTSRVFALGVQSHDIVVPASDGGIAVRWYSKNDDSRRPAVLILHGRGGVEGSSEFYARYAQALAARGMDAWVVSYYNSADAEAMQSTDRDFRIRYMNEHLAKWSGRVRDVVSYVAQKSSSSGKIAVMGFSNGGILAVTAAASDRRVDALVVYYGALPPAANAALDRLPPVLAFHGDADRIIPLTFGEALVAKARALGTPAELIVYPGAGHGFDADEASVQAQDAMGRALAFLKNHIQ
jgi:carboxymethylenebutenolidase